MMRSLYSAISGLKNHQTKMDVIGNNIANVNTSGFKRSRTDFSTMLSQTIKGASTPGQNQGGTNAVQVGMGSMLGSTSQIMSQGSSQTTGQATDLMLQGSGYFVMKNGAQTVYTRAGGFSFDSEGNLEDPASGALVQGYTWPADDSIDPSWAGTGYGNIKFKLGDQLILDKDLVNKLNNMDNQTFTGTVTYPNAWDMYPSYTDVAFKNAVDLEITYSDGSKVNAKPIGVSNTLNKNTFDASTGRVSFDPGLTPVSIVPKFNLAPTDLTLKSNLLVNNNLIGATGITINVPYTIDSQDPINGVLTFGSSFDPSAIPTPQITYTPRNDSIPNATITANHYTDAAALTNATIVGITDPIKGTLVDGTDFTFTPGTGDITFLTGATGPVTIDYTPQPVTIDVNAANGYGVTIYNTPLTGATDLVVTDNSTSVNLTKVAPPASPSNATEYSFDPSTGEVTFGPGFTLTNNTFTFLNSSQAVPNSLDPAPYTFTDPDNLVGAGNLRIEGMTEVSQGQTPESGEYSFDPTTGTITFATGYNPATSNAKMTYAEALPLTGADGNIKTFDVDYLPTPGTPVYVDGAKYTLGTAGELDSTKNEYSVNVVGGKYQITLSNAPSGGAHKIGFDFVEQPHTLSSFSIDQTGTITGVYSDGVSSLTRKIAQVAVAKFPNDQGLQNMGGNFYLESNNSGQVDVGAAGQNGRATIIPSALEMSNVDLAQEFTDMIVTQRGFQANSRVITVSDSLLQELIDLKRN